MKKILLISSILILALSLTACGVKDKAIKEIKGIDLKAYMQEDQNDLKEFKEAYIKDMEKAKNDKEAEKLLKQFKERARINMLDINRIFFIFSSPFKFQSLYLLIFRVKFLYFL